MSKYILNNLQQHGCLQSSTLLTESIESITELKIKQKQAQINNIFLSKIHQYMH